MVFKRITCLWTNFQFLFLIFSTRIWFINSLINTIRCIRGYYKNKAISSCKSDSYCCHHWPSVCARFSSKPLIMIISCSINDWGGAMGGPTFYFLNIFLSLKRVYLISYSQLKCVILAFYWRKFLSDKQHNPISLIVFNGHTPKKVWVGLQPQCSQDTYLLYTQYYIPGWE